MAHLSEETRKKLEALNPDLAKELEALSPDPALAKSWYDGMAECARVLNKEREVSRQVNEDYKRWCEELDKEAETNAAAPKRQRGRNIPPAAEKPLKEQFLGGLFPEQRERVEKYFPRAIEHGCMEETDEGYRWKTGRGQPTQRAYFLTTVLRAGKNMYLIPYDILANLFGIMDNKQGKNQGRTIWTLYDEFMHSNQEQKWLKWMQENIFYD